MNWLIIPHRSIKVINIMKQKWKRKTVEARNNARNMPHTRQLNIHTYAESMDIIRQSRNRTSAKYECKNQTQIK